MVNQERVVHLIQELFPGGKVKSISEKGFWLNGKECLWRGGYIVYFSLDDDSSYILKIEPSLCGEPAFCTELSAAGIFKKLQLPAPEIITVEHSAERIGYPFYIAKRMDGTKLASLWLEATEQEKTQIYHELGKVFSRMHEEKNSESGLFGLTNPYMVRYPGVNPSEYMFRAELQQGSAKLAVELGHLSPETYRRVIKMWEENLDFLKCHEPSLVHYSSFPWTLSFVKAADGWRLCKITGLADVLWWDSACNLAQLKYPPFLQISDSHWKSFLKEYQGVVDERRINLYGLLVKISAAMGTYCEPQYLASNRLRADLEEQVQELIAKLTG